MSHLSHGWYSRYVICCITSWHMVCDISICIVLADLVDFSWDEMSWVTWMFLYGPCPLGLRPLHFVMDGLGGVWGPLLPCCCGNGLRDWSEWWGLPPAAAGLAGASDSYFSCGLPFCGVWGPLRETRCSNGLRERVLRRAGLCGDRLCRFLIELRDWDRDTELLIPTK